MVVAKLTILREQLLQVDEPLWESDRGVHLEFRGDEGRPRSKSSPARPEMGECHSTSCAGHNGRLGHPAEFLDEDPVHIDEDDLVAVQLELQDLEQRIQASGLPIEIQAFLINQLRLPAGYR